MPVYRFFDNLYDKLILNRIINGPSNIAILFIGHRGFIQRNPGVK